jgi:hypothetical protein
VPGLHSFPDLNLILGVSASTFWAWGLLEGRLNLAQIVPPSVFAFEIFSIISSGVKVQKLINCLKML